MSFSNLQYLLEHLPARFRAADAEGLLQRFLQHFGEKLDGYDELYDTFDHKITQATADVTWIKFWMEVVFDWSWYPWWFTLANFRNLYGNMPGHLARRGTAKGIELFLLDFGITAKVYKRSRPWGKFVWGQTSYAITRPLRLIIEIQSIRQPGRNISFWGRQAWGKSFYSSPRRSFTDREILDLVRYQQPNAQRIYVIWKLGNSRPSTREVWGQISW